MTAIEFMSPYNARGNFPPPIYKKKKTPIGQMNPPFLTFSRVRIFP